ncbi:unnamed protein product [Moneuplotes crassus]|uniref:Uncharacterized protein n=1 Tax=Euplotes crassus TaxID=5936 RepID=A0AAD1XW52_EUPCR|nr:unnamed protein product [Moneuplotes crassus]
MLEIKHIFDDSIEVVSDLTQREDDDERWEAERELDKSIRIMKNIYMIQKEFLVFEGSDITIYEWFSNTFMLVVERRFIINQPNDPEDLLKLLNKQASKTFPMHISWNPIPHNPQRPSKFSVTLKAWYHFQKPWSEAQQGSCCSAAQYIHLIPIIKHLARKFESIWRSADQYSSLSSNDFFNSEGIYQLIN